MDFLDFKLDFNFLKLLGFKECHAGSFIAFVFEVRAARYIITSERRPIMTEKKILVTSTCSHLTHCQGRLGALKSFYLILSYLRTHDPERILPYVDRGTFVF